MRIAGLQIIQADTALLIVNGLALCMNITKHCYNSTIGNAANGAVYS